MAKVLTHMTMSLDGYIADPHDQVGEIFEWYGAGDIAVPSANKDISFKLDRGSADIMRDLMGSTGALISGRRLFDITNGWGDNHPAAESVVVVTHSPPADAARKWPKTTFVNDVASAVARAQEIAGDRNVVIASASIIQQALDLGLVDEICISLAPVLFGEGIPYFSKLAHGHQVLDDPIVVQGRRALHLRYPVRH